MSFTTEQIIRARQAKSAEELLTLAKENGVDLSAEQAKVYFTELHKEGDLSDDELNAVAGGKRDDPPKPQEYQVIANWKPICNGKFLRDPHVSFWVLIGVDCCGNCKHFKYDGSFGPSKQGVCRREFE